MKSFRPFPLRFLARAILPVMVAGLAVSLAGCSPSADDNKVPTQASAKKAADSKGGFTLKGDGLDLDAATGTAMMRGFSPQPLSVRIMSGWVDTEKAKRAAQETDEAEKKKLAMGSFGLLTLQIAADKAEPGTYRLLPKAPKAAPGGASDTGTVIIDRSEDAGLDNAYTSQSGTLTITAVTRNDSGVVTGVEGKFDGQFGSDAGDSRGFSGGFRFTPTK